jgi:hypothetical protein
VRQIEKTKLAVDGPMLTSAAALCCYPTRSIVFPSRITMKFPGTELLDRRTALQAGLLLSLDVLLPTGRCGDRG